MQASFPSATESGGSYYSPGCAFRDLGKYIHLQTKRQWLHFWIALDLWVTFNDQHSLELHSGWFSLVWNGKVLSCFTDALQHFWHNGTVNLLVCSITLISLPIHWSLDVVQCHRSDLCIVLHNKQSTLEATYSMYWNVNPKWHLMLNKCSKNSFQQGSANYLQLRGEYNRITQLLYVKYIWLSDTV